MTSGAHQMPFVRYHGELCIYGCRYFIAKWSIKFFCSQKPLVNVPAGQRVLARVGLMSGWR
jgi:hypothetical protein